MSKKRDEKNNKTEAWKYYELGRSYNNSLIPNQYQLVDTNIEFFAGNQWLHIPETPAMSKLSRPTFNIIKRIASLFVASLTSTATTINFEPLSYYDAENLDDPEFNAAVVANSEVRNLYDKFKMDYRSREALFDGAQTGDYCAHFWWNPEKIPYGGAFGAHKGEIEMELVDGINVMFGNPNTADVQSQPYVLIIGRDTVENLKWEAEQNKKDNPDSDTAEHTIKADGDWTWQAGIGGKRELHGDDDKTGKALYVLMYTKVCTEEPVLDSMGNPMREEDIDENGNRIPETDENGMPLITFDGTPVYKTHEAKRLKTTVHVTKATKSTVIYEDVDTGLSLYPIAWANWERQKNQYHGRALVTGIVPNQIFINSMMAMVFRHLQLQAFPKTIYNADLINGWDNEIGKAIGVRNLMPGASLRDVATTMPVADMSNQIMAVIDRAMAMTKECLGATDAQLGNVKPDNTSALMVLQSSGEVPLENIRANHHEWHEDIGAILLDMMGTYYGLRPVVVDREMEEPVEGPDGAPILDPNTGTMQVNTVTRRVKVDFDFSQFKHLWMNISVDVGATTYFSEIAMVQTLDNLRRDGTLEVVDYLERIPDKLVPRKQELVDKLKEQAAAKPSGFQGMDGGTLTGGLALPGEDDRVNAAPAGKTAGGKTPGNLLGGDLQSGQAMAVMPENVQNRFGALPNKAKKALVRSATNMTAGRVT